MNRTRREKCATKTKPLPIWLFYRVETSRVCVAAALWGGSECLDGPSRCVSRGAGITGRGNTGLQHGAWLKVKDALWCKAAFGMRKLAFKIKEGLEAMDGWIGSLMQMLSPPPLPLTHLALWQVRVNREVTPANFHADDRRDYSKRRAGKKSAGASHL